MITNDYDRADELFYYTMKKIVTRLNINLEVNAPVDNGRKLVTRKIDYTRVRNWKNTLENALKKLDVLFNPDCTFAEAVDAWGLFFNHSYWKDLNMQEIRKSLREDTQRVLNNTEEYIEDKYIVNEYYDVSINCKISGNGIRPMPIIRKSIMEGIKRR